jgi:hypothetical protein
LVCGQHNTKALNSVEVIAEPDLGLPVLIYRENTMSTFKDDTMHVLETTIEKYGTAGDTCTESAIRDLLTDLRRYCDMHEIDFEDRLEGSLDVYLEAQEDPDDETSAPRLRDRGGTAHRVGGAPGQCTSPSE